MGEGVGYGKKKFKVFSGFADFIVVQANNKIWLSVEEVEPQWNDRYRCVLDLRKFFPSNLMEWNIGELPVPSGVPVICYIEPQVFANLLFPIEFTFCC